MNRTTKLQGPEPIGGPSLRFTKMETKASEPSKELIKRLSKKVGPGKRLLKGELSIPAEPGSLKTLKEVVLIEGR